MTLQTARRFRRVMTGAGLAAALATGGWTDPVRAQADGRVDQDVIRNASAQDETLRISRRGRSGLVEFAAARDRQRGIDLRIDASAPPATRALHFVRMYGQAFGIESDSAVQVVKTTGPDTLGIEHVRLQRLHRGVPVTGAEFVVHLRGARVVAANAKTTGELSIDVTPSLPPSDAREQARQLIENARPDEAAQARFGEPRLEVLDPGIFQETASPPRLAWFVEATGPALREYIWVDALTGAILLHFNQLPDARSRRVYTSGWTSALPGTPIRLEGWPATGDADADAAYDYGGDFYDYFLATFGRDSYDNQGASLDFTVHFCPPAASCPYRNAYWDGTRMVFGDGFAQADDVVAHELTHAVIEKTANLFYFTQSGALNEAYADMFGETVDLWNGRGNDTAAVRWQLGEDLPGIGAVRDMMQPHTHADPDRVGDLNYACGSDDNGGIHTNSGVADHAYALMSDGGTFNGFTIGGIGIEKAARIHYRALTTYLTSGSNFADHATAVEQACSDLSGTSGITAADCAQVEAALEAVEMSGVPSCSGAAAIPALCPAGRTARTVFSDDFEATSTKWAFSTLHGSGGSWNAHESGWARSGQYSAYGTDPRSVSDHVLTMTSDVVVPPGGRFQFNHAFSFGANAWGSWDGGVIEYSTDSGASWLDAQALISAGQGYTGTIATGHSNPVGGRSAFTRASIGYVATQLNLSPVAGSRIRFRFRIGTDSSATQDEVGWVVDDVSLYSCAWSIDPPALLGPVNNVVVVSPRPTYTWQAVPGAEQYYVWVSNGGSQRVGEWITAAAAGCPSGAGTCTATPASALVDGPARWQVKAWSTAAGHGPWSADGWFTVAIANLPPPTLVAPIGSTTVTTSRPTFTWNALDAADEYYVWVVNGGTVSGGWYTAAVAGCAAGTGTCSAALASPLVNGPVRWQVKGWNSTRGHGPWSADGWFTVAVPALTAPGLVSPLGNATVATTLPAYRWNAVTGAEEYYLWVVNGGQLRVGQWVTASAAGCAGGTGTCSFTPSSGLVAGSVRWQVKAWSTAAGHGPWSADGWFTVALPTLSPPTLVSPTGGTTVTTSLPTYTWNAVVGAEEYYVWVVNGGQLRVGQWVTASAAGCAGGTGTCSLTPSSGLVAGSVRWQVKAWSTALGHGPWSADGWFTVSALSTSLSLQ